MKLMLSMMVKNESARIERALASVVQFIDSWVILDTGSTDDTKEKITKFFQDHQIPGEIREGTFVDWSQARNEALGWARNLSVVYLPDCYLLLDADMELVVKDREKFLLPWTGCAVEMYQQAGSLHYTNVRMVAASAAGRYRGVTHEYFDGPTTGLIEQDVAYFIDHADGANRPDKFKRDIRLLLKDLKTDPNNERSFYYLAQSYRDAGLYDKAIKWFKRRVDAGGWDEERWQAQTSLATCYKDKGNEAEFIRNKLIAYNMRPTRAESMYDLANHYRCGNMQAAAVAAAEAVEHLKTTDDKLFVNKFVYDVGIKEELSICSFYVPGKKDKGYRLSSELAMQEGPYGNQREQARNNLYHYLEPLSKFCPTFKSNPIAFTPEPGWAALNPSVTNHMGKLVCNLRTVNYTMDNEGRYLINGTDGTTNAENPIRTRNFLLRFDNEPKSIPSSFELTPPVDLPCEFPLVVGFEDLRLISLRDELWGSSTVRQIHPDGNCEQVLTSVHALGLGAPQRMLRNPRQTEKNWSPIVEGGRLRFMYRPLEIVDTDGKTISKHDPGLAVDNISGSSQLIPFQCGWLAITHEARYLPGSCLRYYYHRFAHYTHDSTKVKFSRPFYFNEKAIEFCAGMCWRPGGANQLVISYGVRDCEAHLAVVDAAEVKGFLCLDLS